MMAADSAFSTLYDIDKTLSPSYCHAFLANGNSEQSLVRQTNGMYNCKLGSSLSLFANI